MKYPIFIYQASKKTVFATCPIIKDFYASGDSVEDVLKQLNDKFICFLHDENIELEIIPIERKISGDDGLQKGAALK